MIISRDFFQMIKISQKMNFFFENIFEYQRRSIGEERRGRRRGKLPMDINKRVPKCD
jgi:hypothetical protein